MCGMFINLRCYSIRGKRRPFQPDVPPKENVRDVANSPLHVLLLSLRSYRHETPKAVPLWLKS